MQNQHHKEIDKSENESLVNTALNAVGSLCDELFFNRSSSSWNVTKRTSAMCADY